MDSKAEKIKRLNAQAQHYYKAHKETLARLKQLQEWTNDFRTALFDVLKWSQANVSSESNGDGGYNEVAWNCEELISILADAGFNIDTKGGLSIPMPEMAWHTEDSRHLRTYIHQLIELEYGEGAFVRSLSENPQERLELFQQWLEIVSRDQVEIHEEEGGGLNFYDADNWASLGANGTIEHTTADDHAGLVEEMLWRPPMPEFYEDDWVMVNCSECSCIVGYYEFDGEARGEVVCEGCFEEKRKAAEREARDE